LSNGRVVGGLWVRLGKIKCAAIWVGLCGCIAALLILRSVGILSSVFSTVVDGLNGRHSITGNVPALGAGLQSACTFADLRPSVCYAKSASRHARVARGRYSERRGSGFRCNDVLGLCEGWD
jgi:hypothetical protein